MAINIIYVKNANRVGLNNPVSNIYVVFSEVYGFRLQTYLSINITLITCKLCSTNFSSLLNVFSDNIFLARQSLFWLLKFFSLKVTPYLKRKQFVWHHI